METNHLFNKIIETRISDKIEFNRNKTQKVTVEEIHKSFLTEVDRLLEEAQIKVTVKEPSMEKAERLKRLGFVRSKEVMTTLRLKDGNMYEILVNVGELQRRLLDGRY